ncbi:class I adenylate-forming enzyme family protein [Desulfitobacterium chlororespirans]|uniref:Fatty-acyl-CoA synthase n=1 Tax=Desulfitobacterium chlororespirans DSM 11544 TaxID=1121395 RepID=A0A1M7UZB4_9FIRM|nr:AMP-binding protein [Desulfitobacterium chlororespirans]SHN88275.1 fatty-acyl-CoA synthase [Desulfitobacterium chlororespirans DSM 11544]
MKHDLYRKANLSLSYWPADTSTPLLNLDFVRALRDAAAKVPDRIALAEGSPEKKSRKKITYLQLLADSERLASALLEHFKPGDRIAVWGPNCIEWVLIQFGCAIAGMTLVTVNPSHQEKELEYILRQSKAAGIFVKEEYRSRSLIDIASKVSKNLPALKAVIGFADINSYMFAAADNKDFPDINPNDPCILKFTSGTTGFPKGAVLCHGGVLNASLFTIKRSGLEEGGVLVNPMPMCHVGGCGVATPGTILQLGTQVIMTEFYAELLLELIEEEKGTFTILVPTMIEAVLNHPNLTRYDISSLKSILSGASKVDASLVQRVRSQLGVGVTIGYGQTECMSISQTHMDDSFVDQSETIGQPMPQCEVKIASPEGDPLPIGERGEICCRGYQTMIEYDNMPEETAGVLKSDGWLHTGDLGLMDERGFLKFCGRLKEMIVRGGENIYPAEIELVLNAHPLVERAAIVGVSDEYWGEQVHAVILPKDQENPPDPYTLYQCCDSSLAHFKVPKYWYSVDEFPTTETGKIQRFLLKEWIEQGKLKRRACMI